MDDAQKVGVAFRIDLDEEVVLSCRVVALHDLRNLLELLDDPLEIRRILQIDAHIGTGLVTDLLRIDDELGSFDDTGFGQFLYTLVNGGTGDIAGPCHLQEGNSCVLSHKLENLDVKCI